MLKTTSPNTACTIPIGVRKDKKLGILFEIRWLSMIDTAPVTAAEAIAIAIHMKY